MSSPTSSKSADTFTSPTSTLSASQYPFPQDESSRRPTSSHRYPMRRGSTASSVVSIGGILDTSQSRGGSIAEFGQNAISTLLQPPIVRTGLLPHTSLPSSNGYKPPSSKDIPPVALTNIPHVDSKSFQPYLAQVGSLYDAFQRAKEGGEDGDTQLFRRNKAVAKPDELEVLINNRLDRRQTSIPSHSRSGSVNSLGSPLLEAPQPKRRTSGGSRRAYTVTPLSTIPPVYLEEDFHLENPRTFDIVSERSEVVRPLPKPPGVDDKGTNGAATAPRKALATNAILQEKLSWYMDTVEIHLISSISTASASFFNALGSLRELHSEAADSVKRIQALRRDLAKLDEEMALGGLKVVNLRRRKENVRRLGEAVSQLREVVESVSRCEDLIEKGDIEEAMDGLDEVQKLIAGDETSRPRKERGQEAEEGTGRLLDLRGIRALEGASNDLGQLRYMIGRGFEGRFLETLLGDLRQHVETVPSQATLQRWGIAFQRPRGGHRRVPSALPAYMNISNQLRSQLRMELAGLARAGHTMPAATGFKEAVLREMKSLIRKQLPSSNEDDNESMMSASTHGGRQMSQQEKSTILARNLRALETEDAEAMFTRIYTGVSEALRRLSVQVKVLLDITSGIGSPPNTGGMKSPPKSPNFQSMDGYLTANISSRTVPVIDVQEDMQQALDMSSLLGQGVDIVQAQITKILKVRSEQNSHLPLEAFLRYVSLNRLFADECEHISGRSGIALKTVVDGQIKDFVAQFGDSQRRRIVQVMDSDRWDAKDFGDAENKVLARIIEGSTRDCESWSETSKIWLANGDRQGQIEANGLAVNGDGPVATGKEKIRSATLDEQKYILPESAMAILKNIDDFQHFMTVIPSMIQEVATSLLDCLKLFNSRSSQLILGAGATRSAGLRNITTKHLALASQALSFIIALIPYVREFVRRHSATSSSLMTDFDKVKRLYQEHQSGIHEKLVDIMSSRAATHVSAMKKIDWDAQAGNHQVNAYMETLTKETTTLQKVLAKHLPEMTVSMIMTPVFASYREQWTRAFQEVPLKSESGKQKMLSDAEFFNAKVSKIDGAGDLGDHLINVIQAKPVAPSASDRPSSEAPTMEQSATSKPAEEHDEVEKNPSQS